MSLCVELVWSMAKTMENLERWGVNLHLRPSLSLLSDALKEPLARGGSCSVHG